VTKEDKEQQENVSLPFNNVDGHNSIRWPTEKGPNLQIRASQDSVDATEGNWGMNKI
jgi:hypothetical protein